MTLASGSRLGPYEITAPLGSGGMGEVYKALDTRLVSPDGRWIAHASNESGRFEVYVRNFPTPAGKWQISQGGAVYSRWRGDGRELFYGAPAPWRKWGPASMGKRLKK